MLLFDKNYHFIEQLMKSALKIDVELLKPPFISTFKVDHSLRQMFWKDYKYDDSELLDSLRFVPKNQLLCLHSKLGFTNIIYRVPDTYEDCMLFFGPYVRDEVTNKFISRIISENNFPISVSQTIKSYYQTLPHVNHITVVNTIQTLLSLLVSEYIWDSIETTDFSYVNQIDFTPALNETHNFTTHWYNDFFDAHNTIFQQIGEINYTDIYKDLDNYYKKSGLFNETNIEQIQYSLQKFNIICDYVVSQKKVHYLYVNRVYTTFAHKILEERSRDALLLLPYEMVKKYSLTVQNYSLSHYSKNVRKAIDYINLNLQEPLSLSSVAEKINKSSSFLAKQVKKETGQPITNYIHDKRIESAINLLNTTSLSIQEIAEKVGISELYYFSKLFKKKIGMSPTEYKKLIK